MEFHYKEGKDFHYKEGKRTENVSAPDELLPVAFSCKKKEGEMS